MILFDFLCRACGAEFEELVARDNPDSAKCPKCTSSKTTRLVTGTRIDPRLGVDGSSFPTMADKWTRTRRERLQIEQKREAAHGPDA